MPGPSTPVHTNSTPVPSSPAPAFWTNVTDPFLLETCLLLINQSMSNSGFESDIAKTPTLLAFIDNIAAKRTTVWLWTSFNPSQSMTVVFHGADFPPAGSSVTTGRFYTCAGADSLTNVTAAALWVVAIHQFASINGNVGTDSFYFWSVVGEEPSTGDPISGIINSLLTQNKINAASGENYAQAQPRWPTQQTTQRFAAGL
jgi:hypothetical protein